MDHPISAAEHFAAARRGAYVPPIGIAVPGVQDRLERHLATLVPDSRGAEARAADAATRPDARPRAGADPVRLGVAQTAQLLRDITPRPTAPTRRRMSVLAPLRSFKRWIGF